MFLESTVTPVDPQEICLSVVGDVHIRVSIAVEVTDGDAQPSRASAPYSRDLRYVRKASVTLVAIQDIGNRRKDLRTAEIPPPGFISTHHCGLVDEIVRNVNVEKTVAVEIQEGDRRAPIRIRNTRNTRDVIKRAITAVAVERIRADICNVHIYVTIVIDVPHRHTHPETFVSQTGTVCHIHEGSVAFLAVQTIAGWSPAGRVDAAPVHEIDIQVTVVVVVQKRSARARDLRHVIRKIDARVVNEV